METATSNLATESVEYPNLLDRVQSTFIDLLVILVLLFIVGSVLDRIDPVPDFVRMILFFALWVLYEPLCTTLGFTIGNYIKGIRVRRNDNMEKRINIFNAIVRYIVKILLGWISFLTIHSNPQKRAIHDLIAGSVMIKYNAG